METLNPKPGVPYEKGWKITKKATCVYEGEYVHMKGKNNGFWLKMTGGLLRKKGWENTKKTTCVYEEDYVHMKGKSNGFWLKLIGGPYEKG